MNSFIYQLFFFITIYIKTGHNYPTGAPDTACATMMPQHGVDSRQCSSKYIIQSDKSQYYTDDTVLITISGSTNSDNFQGFLLIAKTQTSGQIVGNWSLVTTSNTQTVDCDEISSTGVTHTSNDSKSSIQAVWHPPSTKSGESTVIKVTIVTAFAQIYVNCFSVTLAPRQDSQSTNEVASTIAVTSNPATSASSSTAGTNTTIVSQSRTSGASIDVTYSNGVSTVKMTINNLITSQWFALGLSLDNFMGEDHVFVCRRLADDTVSLDRRVNSGGYVPPDLVSTISNPGGTFTPTLQKLENGVTYCEFTLSNFAGKKRRRRAISSLSQSQTYIPLIAIGNLDSSNQLIMHTTRTALSQNIRLDQTQTITYGDPSDQTGLMKSHGIIMIFTWILFISTGIFVARYFKPAWPDRKVCGKPIWFAVHGVLMMSGATLTIIAFILILVYKQGAWVSQSDQLEFAHSIIGIIIICLAIIQPIMAFFRCKPDTPNRFIFNYAHAAIGFSAFIYFQL